MQNRVFIGLAFVGVLLFGWLLIGPDRCAEPPPPPPDAAPPDAAVPDAAPPDAAPPDGFAVDDETLTIDEVRRIGLLDRPARFVEAFFEGDPNWTRDPRAPAPTWVNHRGTRVSFKIRGGRVASVGAEFAENALSADATALSGFFVGQHDALPVHLEMHDRSDVVPRLGAFEDANGRRLYFRVRMRTEGDPPWGPAEFEVSARPWPGQSPGLTPLPPMPGQMPPVEPATGPMPTYVYPDAPAPGPIQPGGSRLPTPTPSE